MGNCKRLKFKDTNGKKVKLKKAEIHSYKMEDYTFIKKKFQHPISFSGSIGYMLLLNKGKISLYSYKYDAGARNDKNVDNNGRSPLGYFSYVEDYYIEKGDSFELVKKSGLKKIMAKYLSDNSELLQKVNYKILKYKNIEEVISIYNANTK